MLQTCEHILISCIAIKKTRIGINAERELFKTEIFAVHTAFRLKSLALLSRVGTTNRCNSYAYLIYYLRPPTRQQVYHLSGLLPTTASRCKTLAIASSQPVAPTYY